MRRFLAVSAALLLLVLGSQAVLAQYQSNGSLGLSAGTISAGGQVTVSGDGYAATSPVKVTIASAPTLLTTVTTDASGAFSTKVGIPSGLSGTHTISATGTDPSGSVRVLSSTINVLAAPTTDTAPTAPSQSGGTDPLVIGLAGSGIVIMTGLLVLFTTRQRRARR